MTTDAASWYVCGLRCYGRVKKTMSLTTGIPAKVTGNRACVVCKRHLTGDNAIEVAPKVAPVREEVKVCASPSLF